MIFFSNRIYAWDAGIFFFFDGKFGRSCKKFAKFNSSIDFENGNFVSVDRNIVE